MKPLIVLLWIAAGTAAAQAPPLDLRAWLDEVSAATAAGACDGPFGACMPQAEALDAAVGWSAGCRPLSGPSGERPPGWGTAEVTWLSREEALVSLGCSFGAYQGSSVVLRVASDGEGWRARMLAFPVVHVSEDGTAQRLSASTEVMMWMGADADTRTAVVFGKARGIGDCGTWSLYEFDDHGQPFLREARARACTDAFEARADDAEAVDPSTWPVVYRLGE